MLSDLLDEQSLLYIKKIIDNADAGVSLEKKLTFLSGNGSKIKLITDLLLSANTEIGVLKVYQSEYGALTDADFKTLVEHAGDVVYRTDIEGNFIYINQKGIQLSGYTRDELLGKSYLDLIVPEQRVKAYEFYMNQMLSNTPTTYFEFKGVAKNGVTRWIGQNVRLRKKNGEIVGVDAIARNITKRKKTENRLKTKIEFEKLITKISTRFINLNFNKIEVEIENILLQFGSFLDMKGLTVHVLKEELKPSHYFWFDQESGQIQSLDINDFATGEYEQFISQLEEVQVLEVNPGEKSTRHFPTLSKFLKQHNLKAAINVPLKAGNTLSGILTIFADKSYEIENTLPMVEIIGRIFTHLFERQKAELKRQQLVEEIQAKNKELQDFAYMISHDLKAPIRGIGTLAEWIREDHADKLGNTGKEHLELMTDRVELVHDMIDSILSYVKIGIQDEDQTEKVDFNKLVNRILNYLDIPENIHCTVQELPVMTVNKVQMEQVFQNLLSNAVRYMDKEEGLIRVDYEDDTEQYVFCISDNGPGIDKAHQYRIFDLFKTVSSQPENECSGVGLAITKKIVELNGGNIWVESTPGMGADFYFTLSKKEDKE